MHACRSTLEDPTADAAQERIRDRILHGRFDGREQERSRRVDEIVRAGLPHDGPGLALTVVQNGRTVHSRGYGLADLETGEPLRATTRVHAASVAKQFTAYSIFLLQDEGRLSIEDPIQRYIPEMTGFGGVRIRHLLEHTSGIRDQWQLLGLTGVRTDGDIVTQEDVLRLLSRQQGTGYPPGARQSYCNSGYTLLAEIVERVSGLTFREFTAQRIFRPLGMERSCFVDDAREPFQERAASYEEEGGAFRAVPLNFATYGATGLLTTTEDLARWGADLLAHGVVRPDLLEAMQRPGLLPDGEALDFVSGLHAGQVAGQATLGHPGADGGYRSAVLVVPDSDLVIALLGNFDGVDMWGLPERIATVFLHPSPATAEAPAAEAEPPVPPPPSTPPGELELSAFEGTYYSSELGTAYEIAVEGNALVARHARNGTLVLEPVGPDHFACDRWFLRQLRFVRDGQQRITGLEASSSRSEGSRFLRIPR